MTREKTTLIQGGSKALMSECMWTSSGQGSQPLKQRAGGVPCGALPALTGVRTADDGEAQGVDIVRNALSAPARLLSENAGFEGAPVVDEILRRSGAEGMNVATGAWDDLVRDGVVDAVMVTRTALQSAASISSLMLTTELLINEVEEKADDSTGGTSAGRRCGRHCVKEGA